jgi:hypothetical protein
MHSGAKRLKKIYIKKVLCNFLVRILWCFQKKKNFFCPENMKKLPSKVAHNRPQTLFSVLARLPKRPKKRNPLPPKAPNAGLGI